jgi:hypothetical protein
METQCNTCPLDGTHYVQFCALWPAHKEAAPGHKCEHTDECNQIGQSLVHIPITPNTTQL